MASKKAGTSKGLGGRRLGRAARIEAAVETRIAKKKEKRRRQNEREQLRKQLGDEAAPKEKPKTLETLREYDVTMVDPDDQELQYDEQHDEMAAYFNRSTTPKVLITISAGARTMTWKFCHELQKCIPQSEVFSRKAVAFKRLVKQAVKKEYTDIVVVNEDRNVPNALTLCHLPDGPTAKFKLTNVRLPKDIKKHGESSSHYPEVVLNNFNTRLGITIARMFACLFPQDPQFHGRRVVTFHNQRDYIFVRHHRYQFKKDGTKTALLELGPRFTLKLRSLQKGTFDTKFGEYIWIHKRHEMETSRRRFFL